MKTREKKNGPNPIVEIHPYNKPFPRVINGTQAPFFGYISSNNGQMKPRENKNGPDSIV